MKHTKVAVAAAALLAGAISVAGATSASADFTPQSRDVVGAGSDTIQFALNYLADGTTYNGLFRNGYNSAASARLVSFDAITTAGVTHDQIVLKTGTAPVQRPNGSGEGKSTLISNSNLNYARSSSSLSASEISSNLYQVPFAVDGLGLGVSAAGTNAPATISAADMVKIYDGTYTNWSQLGGANAPIVPYIPQSGSGTRSFFEAQLKAANGNVTVVYGANVKTSQEHDPAVFDHASSTYGADAVNAVAPFSTGRAGLNPSLVKIEAGFSAKRAMYIVVRDADRSSSWFNSIFSTNGYICSSAAKNLLTAAGFGQLSVPDDGGVCGVPTQAATTNFTVN